MTYKQEARRLLEKLKQGPIQFEECGTAEDLANAYFGFSEPFSSFPQPPSPDNLSKSTFTQYFDLIGAFSEVDIENKNRLAKKAGELGIEKTITKDILNFPFARLPDESFSDFTDYRQRYRKIRVFPGSQSEYEKLVGYKVKIIDIDLPNLGIIFLQDIDYQYYCMRPIYEEDEGDAVRHETWARRFISERLEAIIRAYPSEYCRDMKKGGWWYGLPVRKK